MRPVERRTHLENRFQSRDSVSHVPLGEENLSKYAMGGAIAFIQAQCRFGLFPGLGKTAGAMIGRSERDPGDDVPWGHFDGAAE